MADFSGSETDDSAGVDNAEAIVNSYMREDCIGIRECPLLYWKQKERIWPELAKVVRGNDILGKIHCMRLLLQTFNN